MLQPALLGGVVIGVLSALPVINLANCCCAWVLFGGGLAAYLMQQQRPEPITAGDGALVGLAAGAIGAVVLAIVSIPINLMMSPFQAGMLEDMIANARDLPPEARAFLESLRGGVMRGVASVFAFVLSLFLFSIFGTIGGLFGALFFRKNAPPPPPPPVPTFTPPTFTPPTFTPPAPPLSRDPGASAGQAPPPTWTPPPPPGGDASS